jgi:TP901 family phage tail tape measure protein
LKKLDKTVGDNFRNVGNYKNALSGLQRGLGALGLAFGVSQVFRTGSEAIIDFNQAVADLSAITGASGEDLDFYKKKANELGIGVEGGASAVIEAYKLIGSAKPELLENAEALNQLTESAIMLSQASGLELPEASKQLTDAMNQFGASADEAGKFIDVLASGAKFGSAEIPQITEALLKFGAIAKATNVSVEESTGAIELLAENGLKGAEAGTKLRNAMLKLSAPDALPKKAKDILKDMNISFTDLADKTKPFSERLKVLQPLLKNSTGMVKVFGTENVVAGQVLLENTERLEDLTTKMHTNGVAQEQANERTNTLGHSLIELKNTFVGLFTEISANDGVMQIFINAIKFLKENLTSILTIIGKVTLAFVVYKTTMIGLRTIQKLYNTDFKNLGTMFKQQIPLTKAYRQEQERLATATNESKIASKGLGSAIAGIGLGIIVGVVTELAIKFVDLASGMSDARRQAQLIAIDEEKGRKTRDDLIKQEKELFEEAKRKLDLEMDTRRAQTNNAREKKKIDKEQIEREKELLKTSIKSIESKSKSAVISRNEFERDQEALNSYYKDFDKNFGKITKLVDKYGARTKGATDNWKVLLSSKLQGGIKEQEIIIEGLATQTKDWTNQLDRVAVLEQEITTNDTKDEKTKSFNTQLKKTNDYLSKQLSLVQQLAQIEQERDLLKQQKGIDQEFENQIQLLEKTGEFDATRLNDLIREKTSSEVAYLEQRKLNQIQAIDDQYNYEKNKRQEALIDERDKLLAQKDITSTARDKINADFKIKQDELNAQEIDRWFDKELEKEVIASQTTKNIEELRNQELESIDDYNEKFLDKQKDFNEKLKELEQQRQEDSRAFVKATADYFIKKSNEKIAQIEKEIQASQKQYDTLKKLAEEGNIDAKESLAEQQRIIAEANRKKEQEQKRQQRIKLAESVYATYSQKIESNSKNPLAETIRDTTLLNQFISSLPTFEDGTDDTGKNGRGIDGKGGFLSVLHPNERVVPKSLNAQIGGLTNEELSRIANEYNNGKIVRSDSQLGSALELSLLVGKLDNLTKVIQDKPETNIELGEITQGAMEIVKSTKEGNTYTYNRYKVK